MFFLMLDPTQKKIYPSPQKNLDPPPPKKKKNWTPSKKNKFWTKKNINNNKWYRFYYPHRSRMRDFFKIVSDQVYEQLKSKKKSLENTVYHLFIEAGQIYL